MSRFVALLRGINVAGQGLILMDDLRMWFEQVQGISEVSTYMQSGNVLFSSDNVDEPKLITDIEDVLEKHLGYRVDVILRLYSDIKKIVEDNPLTTVKSEEKNRMYVTFLSGVPSFDVRGSLGVYSNDAEYARVLNREVYVYSNNYGKTCFSNTFIEKKLGLKATTRNWTTVNKLLDL